MINYNSTLLNFYIILVFLSSYLLAYRDSPWYTILFNGNTKIKLNTNEEWLSNEEELIDETTFRKASYKYEQSLLTNIYSSNRTYISTYENWIDPKNFSYFTFDDPGTYRFILITLYGDADLYISTHHKYVSYHNYEYNSCTCGIDEILIDSNMKRPIYIGVYGYLQYQTSYYRLLIELVNTTTLTDETLFEPSAHDESIQDELTSSTNKKDSTIMVENEDKHEHVLWNTFLWILSILLDIFI